MKPNCICSFSGSDKAPSELLHFYVGVDCVWKLFLGAFFFPSFLFFLSHHKYAMLPLSSANCCHHPLKFYFLCWFHFCRQAHHWNTRFPSPGQPRIGHGPRHLLLPAQGGTGLSLTCLLASSSSLLTSCSSKHRASASPAISSSSCLAVSILRWLQNEREHKPQPMNAISEQAALGGDTHWLLGQAPKVSCYTLQTPRIQHQRIRHFFLQQEGDEGFL